MSAPSLAYQQQPKQTVERISVEVDMQNCEKKQ
jgi:hypothetical protein